MKKALSALLSAVMLLSCVSFPAAAAGEDYTGKTVVLYTGNVRGELALYPQIAQAKKDYEAKGAQVVLVDVGNYLQGSAMANGTRGEVVYTMMEAAGYAVAGMGLAEFGYTDATTGYPYHGNVTRYYTQAMLQKGTEEVHYNVNRDGSKTADLLFKPAAAFQTVCTNVTPHEVYAFQNFVDVTTEGGLTLRFLGITDPAVTDQVQEGYVTLREPAMPLDDFADVILTLSNDPDTQGEEYTVTVAPDAGFTVGALVVDNKTKELTPEAVTLEGEDADTADLLQAVLVDEPHFPALFESEVILNGSDAAGWNGETNLGDLAADALVWYAQNYIDGINKNYPIVAIQNGGNCDQFIYTGPVTGTDLLNALPFSPMGIGVMEVTGQQLLETIEAATQAENCPGFAQVSGLKYTLNLTEPYDGGAAYGSWFEADSVNRVTITEIAGQSFDSAATYNLVCDNYLMNGNDTYYTLKNAKEAGAAYVNNGGGVKVRDAVELYVKQTMDGVVDERYAAPQGRIAIQHFADVPVTHWGVEAINWAVEAGITQGTGEAEFSPERECTVAEILTMLWRGYGSPVAEQDLTWEELPDYFAAPLAWALEEGLTDGETLEQSWGALCDRGMTVDYLWQLAGRPEVEGPSGFEDVDLLSSHLPFAVAWAVETGVTTGTGETTFSPEKTCTRAEIVTFLERALNK